MIDVAWFELLPILIPLQEGRRVADHLALEGHEALLRQEGAEVLQEPRGAIVLGDCGVKTMNIKF